MLEGKERCVGPNGSHSTMKSTQVVLRMDLTWEIKPHPPPMLPHPLRPRLSSLAVFVADWVCW